jgi:hypothetical protein
LGDSIFITKELDNGWQVTWDVNEQGKVSAKASKTLGKIDGIVGKFGESTLTVSLDTTISRSPKLKTVDSGYNPSFIELHDGQKRTAEKFLKEEQFYKREWEFSSILEPNEYFTEMFPEFEQLLQDKQLGDYVSKFSESASKVQAPLTRNYKQSE